jgi:hypothetical protein
MIRTPAMITRRNERHAAPMTSLPVPPVPVPPMSGGQHAAVHGTTAVTRPGPGWSHADEGERNPDGPVADR